MHRLATLGNSRGAEASVALISRPISHFRVKCLEKLASPFSLRFLEGGDGVEHRDSEIFSILHHGTPAGACCFAQESDLNGCRDCKYHLDTDNTQICISSLDDP